MFDNAPLTVPPTLTNLKRGNSSGLESFPPTLLSLDYKLVGDQNDISLSALFQHTSDLQRLIIRGVFPEQLPFLLEIPPTLITLKLLPSKGLKGSLLKGSWLAHPGWRGSSLSKLVLRCSPSHISYATLDLAQLLPPTLESLHLLSTDISEQYSLKENIPLSLPPSLTELFIDTQSLPSIPSHSSLSSRLYTLTRLEHLKIVSCGDSLVRSKTTIIGFSSFGSLPSKLKKLDLQSRLINPLASANIQQLPLTLRSLQVISFGAELIDDFKSRLPSCHLYVKSNINPWTIPEHVLETSLHWLPHLDILKLATTVECYYRRLGVHLTVEVPNNATERRYQGNIETGFGLPVRPTPNSSTSSLRRSGA